MELMQASHQWKTRPDDERFVSLYDMRDEMKRLRDNSAERDMWISRALVVPTDTGDLIVKNVQKPEAAGATLSNYSFGQLATLAGAPAGYLRKLPAPMAADCLNYGMQFGDERHKDIRGLFTRGEDGVNVRAFNGARYGRIWNKDVVDALVKKFGNGVTGTWKVPGEFKQHVPVTKQNTTLFASDRDMFVFLCDEEHKIEVPNRRGGAPGMLSRGFFVWNSEVGDKTFGLATFLFDYVCANRIVWGAAEYKEIKIRHTSGAPDRWLQEVRPLLAAYSTQRESVEREIIINAQAKRIDDVNEFLAKRFGPRMVDKLHSVHVLEEQRPIETLWDVTTAVTAYAKGITHQDERVKIERMGGDVLRLAA